MRTRWLTRLQDFENKAKGGIKCNDAQHDCSPVRTFEQELFAPPDTFPRALQQNK